MASTQNTSSSKGKYLQYVKVLSKAIPHNYRLRLCRPLACIFSAILHKFRLTGVSPPVGEVARSAGGADRQTSPPVSNLYNLTKNLTAQSNENNYAVLP